MGALVQANHGTRSMLRINGMPVDHRPGKNTLSQDSVDRSPVDSSSVIVILATDAPLLPDQCKRISRRATIGLARTGGVGFNTSGDIFLAFSTGNHYPPGGQTTLPIQMVHQSQFDILIEVTAEAVEEAILNAITKAETMTGFLDHTINAVPLDEIRRNITNHQDSGS